MTDSTTPLPETEQTAETYTSEDLVAIVCGIAIFDAPGNSIPTVNAQRVREAMLRARRLLSPHLEHDRPRKGAVNALLGRALLGVSDGDARLALASA